MQRIRHQSDRQIDSVKAGSLIVRRKGRLAEDNPFAQVRDTMFDIKGPVERILHAQHDGPLFTYLVALPRILVSEWAAKHFDIHFPSSELLLSDHLNSPEQLRRKVEGGSAIIWQKAALKGGPLGGY
jgi:hypothetical protein